MHPGRDDRVEGLSPAPLVVEDELGRRGLWHPRPYGPLGIVQVEVRVHLDEVHVGLVVGIEFADVPPVLARLLVLVRETVRIDGSLSADQRRQDVLAEVVLAVTPGVVLQRLDEDVGLEDVDAHGGQRYAGQARNRLGLGRLLLEADDPLLLVDLDHPEAACGLLHRHLVGRHRGGGALLDVPAQHLRVVHLVDVVAREDHHPLGRLTHDGVQVLVHGVGRAEVPVVADPLLRGQDLDELAEFLCHDAPALPDVAIERQALVLRDDEDAAQAGVDAVAEREVDDAVGAAEVHRWFCTFPGQRGQAFAHPSSQDDDEGVVEHGPPGPVRERVRPRGRPQQAPCWGAAGGSGGGPDAPPADPASATGS